MRTFTAVLADQTWFRVTAIDASGNESGFSEIVDNRDPPAPVGVRIVTETTKVTVTETTTITTETVE